MDPTFGTTLRTTIFGQSHSPAIGCVVSGLPAGFALDEEALARFMARRAPGKNRFSTARRESDRVRIVSGLNERGITCGSALCAIIENTDARTSDYDELRRIPRPGHADLTAHAKWGDSRDVGGGGQFSARLTAPLTAAGGIALQLLEQKGIKVCAHVAQVGDVTDEPLQTTDVTPEGLATLEGQLRILKGRATEPFCTLSEEAAGLMARRVDDARQDLDSIGGAIECVCCGVPLGTGGARSEGIQAAIARIIFSLPAVRGLEFGEGFRVASMRGSENNDAYGMVDGQVRPLTNHAGGTLGGIATGAPIVVRVAVKPTPSIARPQRSVDLSQGRECTLEVKGRHDPCVVSRAVPIIEAAVALAVLDSWLTYPPAH